MIRAMSQALGRKVIATCLALERRGLNQGTSGNVSVRLDAEAFLITPTSLSYDKMKTKDLTRMKLDGTWKGAAPP